jgi:hypothetical protein
MKAVMKSIWTGEPNEKQREQRDFVLRHVLYQNRPCLLADYVQGHIVGQPCAINQRM